jgi:hypothetical protein
MIIKFGSFVGGNAVLFEKVILFKHHHITFLHIHLKKRPVNEH